MTVCKCGRKIGNAICLCSYEGDPITVYSEQEIVVPEIPKIKLSDAKTYLPFEHTVYLWKLLHSYDYKTEKETKKWFEEWLQKLPCGECRVHFNKILEDLPPNFSDSREFFNWGVEAHNKVNERLGKRLFTIEEAVLLWDFKDF
jgi:hypothetical protein